MQLESTGQNDRREQEVEEELIVAADDIEDKVNSRDSQDQPNQHPREDGDDGLMDGLDLLLLQHVAGEEGNDQEHDGDEERPRGGDLLLGGLAGGAIGVRFFVGGSAACEGV